MRPGRTPFRIVVAVLLVAGLGGSSLARAEDHIKGIITGHGDAGSVITPFYDSLLVKVTAHGLRFLDAARRMERCLQEFRIRGVKTNIPFLIGLVNDPTFVAGNCTTRFIDETPELFEFTPRRDRATKLLQYIGDVIVNGKPAVKESGRVARRIPAQLPKLDATGHIPKGTRDKLQEKLKEEIAKGEIELTQSGLRLKVDPEGSRKMVDALRQDGERYDFAFPSSTSTARKIAGLPGAGRSYRTFSSVMAVATWTRTVDLLLDN